MRDSVERFIRISSAEKYGVVIRRLICVECGKIHRELPDFLLPHKHYPADCIEAEIDQGRQAGITDECENVICAYPELSTCMRWRREFKQKQEILIRMQRIVCLYAEHIGFNHVACTVGNTLPMKWRKTDVGWLAESVRIAVNAGLSFCTEFAFSVGSVTDMMKMMKTCTGDTCHLRHNKTRKGGHENMEKNKASLVKWLLFEIRRVYFQDNTAFMAAALGFPMKVLQSALNSNGGQRLIEAFEEAVKYCARNQLELDALLRRYPGTQETDQC